MCTCRAPGINGGPSPPEPPGTASLGTPPTRAGDESDPGGEDRSNGHEQARSSSWMSSTNHTPSWFTSRTISGARVVPPTSPAASVPSALR